MTNEKVIKVTSGEKEVKNNGSLELVINLTVLSELVFNLLFYGLLTVSIVVLAVNEMLVIELMKTLVIWFIMKKYLDSTE